MKKKKKNDWNSQLQYTIAQVCSWEKFSFTDSSKNDFFFLKF